MNSIENLYIVLDIFMDNVTLFLNTDWNYVGMVICFINHELLGDKSIPDQGLH